METRSEWGWRLAKQVGARVAMYRCRQTVETTPAGPRLTEPLSLQELSDRCKGLGYPIARSVLSKLENGHRRSVTVDEVQVLAMALGVAPIDLLFPVGHVQAVEVLPGREVDPYAAMEWFTSHSEDPADPNAKQQMGSSNPVLLWEEHLQWDRLLPALHRVLTADQETARETAFEAVPAEELQAMEDNVAQSAQQFEMNKSALRRVRDVMRALGMTPPALLPETARILGEAEEGSVEPWREKEHREWLAECERERRGWLAEEASDGPR